MEDFRFRVLLNQISENLGSDELEAMKFLCRDLLHSNRLNAADSGQKLFTALQEKGLLDENDPFIVAELLYRTRQFRLLKRMNYNKEDVCKQLKEPGTAKISLYRQFLFEVSEDITMKDLDTVKHFLRSSLSKLKLENITTMLDALTEMEKEGLLEENNMELLENICKEIGEDLVKKFECYRREESQKGEESGPVLAPTPETENEFVNLIPHRLPSGEQLEPPRMVELHNPLSTKLAQLSVAQNQQGPVQDASSSSSSSSSSSTTQSPESQDAKEQDGIGFQGPSTEVTSEHQILGRYKMESKPRGYCVIINNSIFETMPQRKGTEVDAKRLDGIFKWLGFEVVLFRNQSAVQMRETMDRYREMDHSQRDCFVCCILTHGKQGVMCGTDGQMVAIREITSLFSGSQCPTLLEKPKLFFIQACQGTKKQDSVGIEVSPVGAEPSLMWSEVSPVGAESSLMGSRPRSSGSEVISVETDPMLEQDAISSAMATIPDEADFLLGMATVEGYVSFRHTQLGTWYIQSLCENLEKYCPSEDLLSILTIVNRDVSGKKDKKDKTQMPQPSYTLRKKLYFPVTQSFTSFKNST
ncbi:caspase-8-like [Hemiscyllium ocellatum]|uniref:caspase-8-like n=1 Tax=Hemiscyllium ocellatum TaxID=170820 RepID=UPI002966FD3E|nr:caspase-8-like [Hemiscyllium ocellatum]